MRKVLPVVLMLGLAACGTPARWEKLGAGDEMTAADIGACRQAAIREAMRYYPSGSYFGGFGSPVWSGRRGNYMLAQMRQDSDRFYAESRLTAFCMRTKGYELVTVAPPQTQAPQSPEPPLPK